MGLLVLTAGIYFAVHTFSAPVRTARNTPIVASPGAPPKPKPGSGGTSLPPRPPAGSSLAIIGNLGAANVSLDGKPAGDLGQLAAGMHRLVVMRGGQDLHLSLRVAPDGSATIRDAVGSDSDFVLAAMHSADKETLFCRCSGSELQIDGKRIRPFARDLYRVPANRSQLSVTLVHGRKSQPETLQTGVPTQTTVLIIPAALSPATAPQLARQQPPSPALSAPLQTPNQPVNEPQVPVQTASTEQTPPPPAPAHQTAPPTVPIPAPDATEWNTIRDSARISDFQQFVKNYPDSPRVSDARKQIARLQAKLDKQHCNRPSCRTRNRFAQPWRPIDAPGSCRISTACWPSFLPCSLATVLLIKKNSSSAAR